MKTVRVLLFCALVAACLLIAFAFLMDLVELRDVFVLNKELLPSALIAIAVWRGVPFAILTTWPGCPLRTILERARNPICFNGGTAAS